MGADYVARSGLGDELNYVPVDKHTLLAKAYDNIFALGDANDIPASKAGSVAHFAVEVFTRATPRREQLETTDLKRPPSLMRCNLTALSSQAFKHG